MTESSTTKVRKFSGISPVWIVPLLALAVALWMVWQDTRGTGPTITVAVGDAEGIEAGKTQVKVRNVDVGQVTEVRLSEDFSSAVIEVAMNEGTERMLNPETRIWVVKPRIGRQGISGLGTLLSGAYIRLQPGDSKEQQSHFKALEQPPVTSQETPGRRLNLTSEGQTSVTVGDSVQYQGFTVGQVEQSEFQVDERQTRYQIFVKAPYDELITENTRFWLQRGVSIQWNSQGLDLALGSIESLLGASVTFGVPEGQPRGDKLTSEQEFELFESLEEAKQQGYIHGIDYVVLLDESIAGLEKGAPVQFKGVRVGTVREVPLRWFPENGDEAPLKRIPILIRFEPERLRGLVADTDIENWERRLPELFKQGLRANIRASNLLTNTLFVDVRFYPNAGEKSGDDIFAGYPVMPAMASDFTRLEEKLTALLDKFNQLPLEQGLNDFSAAMSSVDSTARKLDSVSESLAAIVEQPQMKQLPQLLQQNLIQLKELTGSFNEGSPTRQQLNQTLTEIEQLSRELKPVIELLQEQPNSLIFSPSIEPDPEPKAYE
ncbi:intermembrane transport protein PqiB [Idiomarina loihiensis]|uniref:Paraquat-inducible protein B, secreted n=2 Tax=Idiomarina TaxID=135575 RepID=Q5QYR9_IDILO|nr:MULTISPECIES: intermembrane transport protein PqiB [Idiomarina]MAA61350.1 paraquat-inducible protein B [Idiomarina sp.]AAV81896.1 Paraquat-inducible protein B, secreted [Idiomarina loihiensis L2TR]AGM35926.1 paraquat-inducible protein B [Idiomarina loihiensis GSL 199]MRJ43481.1 intermembrane transport protein PqiB [Idiomarina loihiensis]TDO53108.1 paraquat-inducible protein B [Idiomarina sp. 017G]|tara:strand:- start:202 stop:1842 length:1641 start_codon:yes stop_codon:yes gene_type:complete